MLGIRSILRIPLRRLATPAWAGGLGVPGTARPIFKNHLPHQHSNIHCPLTTRVHIRNLSTTRVLLNQLQKHGQKQLNKNLLPAVSKATLLSNATNRFSRLLVHIKWPLLRGRRTTSVLDVASAFISWLVMGNLLWIILGTTTFGLVTMYSVHYFDNLWDNLSGLFVDDNNDDKAEDEKTFTADSSILSTLTSSILSHGLGLTLEFQRGHILPELKDGKLRFKNFKVKSVPEVKSLKFNAYVEAMEISLSFNKWYEGNGLIYDMEVFGVHGEVFRNVQPQEQIVRDDERQFSYSRYDENIHYQFDWDHEDHETQPKPPTNAIAYFDPNYQLEHVKIHDSYFEIYNDDTKTHNPLRVTIFGCDLPKLRGDRSLIDFFNANNASGAINDAMFTLHKRQQIRHYDSDSNEDKIIRFKMDGINLESVNKSNPYSKFNWIVNGKAEVIADITLPNLNENEYQLMNEYKRVSHVMSELFNEFVSATTPTDKDEPSDTSDNNPLLKGALSAIYHTFSKPSIDPSNEALSEYVLVNVKVKFSDLKASLPQHLPMASSSGVPFISLHNLRSLIAFINNGDDVASASQAMGPAAPIVIKTTVIERLSDLHNIENLSQTKLFDSIVGDIYEELLKLVKLDEKRIIHEKSSMWSHSLASQLLLLGLGVIV